MSTTCLGTRPMLLLCHNSQDAAVRAEYRLICHLGQRLGAILTVEISRRVVVLQELNRVSHKTRDLLAEP